MLYFLVIWTILLIASSTIGIGLLHGFRANGITRMGDRLILSVWLGLVSLAVVLLALALILPLSPLVGAIAAMSLGAIAMAFPSPRLELVKMLRSLRSRPFLIGMLAVAIGVAAVMTQEVTWLDTGLYHYGSIQWFAQYGNVPGITLLFGNYGFTSSWFALAAPLNPAWLDARVTATTNGFVVLLVGYQGLLHLRRLWQQTATVSDRFMVIFLLLIIPFSRLEAISSIFISPSPDAPILILVGVIAWCILIISSDDSISHQTAINSASRRTIFDVRGIPLFLAGGAVTMKLTALPLLFFALLFYSFNNRFNVYRLLIASGFIALLLTPLFGYNLIASGCPLYPSSLLCFNLPWSPSPETVQTMANNTHGWTTWYGAPPDGMPRWVWALWRWLNDSIRHWLMAVLIALSIGCIPYLFNQRATKHSTGDRWLMPLFIIAITFFMLTTPFFRFALSYLLLLPALSLAIILGKQRSTRSPIRQWHSGNLVKRGWQTPWLFVALLVTVFLHHQALLQLILPPPLKQVAVVQKQVNDVKYWSPQQPDELCWSTTIPCAFSVPQTVVLRDPSAGIQGGFTQKHK